MNELQSARASIDRIDRQMADLFCQRMESVAVIGRYKAENGLPVVDPKRQEQILNEHAEYCENAAFIDGYRSVLREVLRVSCAYQEGLRQKEDLT